jgi:hypothetical protein
MREYKGWRLSARILVDRSEVPEYYLSFYRQVPGRDWYDEVRYDSHEQKRGKKLELPHYHVKVRGSYKDHQQAEADLREIIDEIVPRILEVTEGEKADQH